MPESQPTPTAAPSFAEAFRFWLKLGFISFGGPTGQIAIMHTELVEKKKWIDETRFLHALNYCMLLPGPEAQQLAIYTGWLLHETAGGLAAGILFVLPSMFILWGLSYLYAAFGNVPMIAAVFYGLKPAVMAIVAFAVIRIGRKALKNGVMWSLAGLAFAGIFFFSVPFPAIIASAGVIGFAGEKFWPEKFRVITGHRADNTTQISRIKPTISRALKIIFVCGMLWATPLVLAGWAFGWDGTLFQEGIFFSKAALVTFGGAYAVLPYVADQAVTHFGWLGATQMLDGLGLAETTPGPLIMVVQFVGFMGVWNHSGTLSPLAAATLGSLLTTWVTFVPCFLWVFLGGPYIERLRGNTALSASLSTITAAVVGVVLSLALWFGLHVIFPNRSNANVMSLSGTDWFAVAVSLAAFIGLLKRDWNVIAVVAGSGLLGLLYKLLLP
jgi:chromate transporter